MPSDSLGRLRVFLDPVAMHSQGVVRPHGLAGRLLWLCCTVDPAGATHTGFTHVTEQASLSVCFGQIHC